MNTEYALEKQLDKVTESFHQADMARKYKEITDTHGPSQQLIDFINADGKLGEEIGLEGFESFSTSTQHEILLSKLNPDTMESVAVESFGEFLKKYKNWFLAAGLGGPALLLAESKGFAVPTHWGILVAAGVAGIVLSRADKLVPKMSEIKKHQPIADSYISKLETLFKELPSSDDPISWEAFEKKIDRLLTDFENEIDDASTSYMMKKVEDSDWTPAGFIDTAKWYEKTVKDFANVKKDFYSKLDKIDSSNAKSVRIMNKNLSKILKSLKGVDSFLRDIQSALDKVAKAYDKKEA